MVDRLIATESLSQGAQGIRFVPDIMDEFCMRQIAKMQYRCYYITELDSSICTPVYYTGNKALDRLAGYAALWVRSIFYGSDGRQVEATEPICQGPGRRGAACRKSTIDKQLS